MEILVVGASGATGRLLVAELLRRGHRVRAVVRAPESLPDELKGHENLTLVHASLLDLSGSEMARLVAGCDAVASCLGHKVSFRGIFGPPYRLVTEAIRRLCVAIKGNDMDGPVRFVLMNTAANSNRDLEETVSFAQRVVIGLLRLLVPPHADNEEAADYLRREVGVGGGAIEWCAVRPDGLIDSDEVTAYELHASPTRSALFAAGQTSRINVGHLMADLITRDELWDAWKGRMPVIYNTGS